MWEYNNMQEYSDSPKYLEDLQFVDTSMPYMVTPTFLQWSPREISDSPLAFNKMIESFPWTGPGVLKMDTIKHNPQNDYRYPHNEWLNKCYDFNTQRCLYKGREWVRSEAMLVWHFRNGYRLNALSCNPVTQEEISPGYYYLNLLYRHKSESHKPRTGVSDLVEFIRYLALMPGAPPAVFYQPQAVNSGGSPHLEHLEYERGLSTKELTKLWQKTLGGIQIPGTPYWLAGIYKPKNPSIIPENQKCDKFEKILSQMD